MKITETASLPRNAAQVSDTARTGSDQNQRPVKRALIGGGWIATPAVMAHVRRKRESSTLLRAPQD